MDRIFFKKKKNSFTYVALTYFHCSAWNSFMTHLIATSAIGLGPINPFRASGYIVVHQV